MKLTQYSDLGLRLLMYLAVRSGETVTIQEASERFAVSRNHLIKISHQLTKAGLIESLRGRNGGVRLAVPPASISVAQALRSTEDNFDLVECFNASQNRCVISDVCLLSGVFDSALDAFFKVLGEVTLADLVKNGPQLEKALLPLTREIQFQPNTASARKMP